MSRVTMREMLEAGVHFGHQTKYWNPVMGPYLYGHRNKIHIINLEKTLPLFNDAINYIGQMASKKASILFVGTKRSAQKIIREEAERCGMPYVNRRWLGGLLTNYKTVKQSINRLKAIEAMEEAGTFEQMSKKEALTHKRELEKLSRSLSGIKDMPGIPDVLFVVDVGYEDLAVSEAVKLGIPVVGIVDSNNSPLGVDYMIPGNDDAIRSIRLYAKTVADAIVDGRGSVAQLVGEGDSNEFVELDESGAPVISDTPRKIKTKKTPKKKIVKQKRPAETEENNPLKAEGAEDDTLKSETDEELRSDSDKVEETVQQESAVEASSEEEKNTASKKKVTKKKVTKKKVTKKKVSKKADEDGSKKKTVKKKAVRKKAATKSKTE